VQLEKAQNARVEELKRNLLRYTDELFAENDSMFEMHMRNLANEKLATAHYGPVMLLTLGKVYGLQAKRFRGNFGAYFKCAQRRGLCRVWSWCANVQRPCTWPCVR
jgi:hypothetical protein